MENLMLNIIDDFLDIEEDHKEVWKVEDDISADWCLDKIRESTAEYRRFEMVAKAKIKQMEDALKKEKEKYQRDVSFFESKLRDYFETVEKQETKTLMKYKLPSGELKAKKEAYVFDYNKEKLVEESNKHENMKDYIKIKEDFDWASFKKILEIKGNTIVNKETGEIVELEGLKVAVKPEEFNVEVL